MLPKTLKSRVGGNRKNTPGEADEGWRFSASKAKVTVK
jgi:hypothetical protein